MSTYGVKAQCQNKNLKWSKKCDGYGKKGQVLDTYSMKTYVLLQFEHKTYVTIIVKLLYRATSRNSVKFDNDCDAIFMFKM